MWQKAIAWEVRHVNSHIWKESTWWFESVRMNKWGCPRFSRLDLVRTIADYDISKSVMNRCVYHWIKVSCHYSPPSFLPRSVGAAFFLSRPMINYYANEDDCGWTHHIFRVLLIFPVHLLILNLDLDVHWAGRNFFVNLRSIYSRDLSF